MELVYLWVEDYKNIHHQGFNFSQRFECEFKAEYEKDKDGKEKLKDDCQLVIKPKEHIENFFGKNINITAIVGENGSGKSSILELFSSLVLNLEIQNKIHFSIFYNDEIICFTNIDKLDLKYTSCKIESLENVINYDIFSVFYSSNFTNGNQNSILELFTGVFYRTHNKSDSSYENHGYKNDNLKNQSLLNFLFNSSRILDFHPTSSAYRQQHSFTIKEQLDNYEISKVVIMLQFLKHFGKDYLPINLKKSDSLIINIQHNKYTAKVHHNLFIDKIKDLLKLEIEFHDDEEAQMKYYQSVNKAKYLEAYKSFFSFIDKKIDNLKDYENFKLNIDDGVIFVNLYLDLYRFNRNLLDSIFDFKFKNLSSGEENLVLMFALFERGISSFVDKKIKNNEYNLLLMLDEIENNFHSQWQKQLFSQLHKFLNIISNHWKTEYSKTINFSILLASHSPFILSDLSKENVMFLKKDENGNCRNVTIETKIQPFGANIHTLLSHGFFMKDGLMGEFAKGKIDKAIKYLNQKSLSKEEIDYCENIISIIGEPILKNQLQRMLDSKRLSEIDVIKKQIQELQDELAKKENKKDD